MPFLESLKFMKYRGVIITKKEYFGIIQKISLFIKSVMDTYGLSESELRYYNYFEYCENVLDYVIKGVNIKGPLAKHLAGSVMCEDRKIVIGYNTNMTFGRQNFTILHEITHAQVDMNAGNDFVAQNFTDLMTNKNYSSSDQFREVRADICASYLMITDPALRDCIFEKYTFTDLIRDFGISSPALKLRLKNYLVFNINLHPSQADHLINYYIKSGDAGLMYLYMFYEF